jgi:hypothetical protein
MCLKEFKFMKPIEPKFKSGGFEFQQLKRTGDVAIFQKGTPTFDRQSSFEVIRNCRSADSCTRGDAKQ